MTQHECLKQERKFALLAAEYVMLNSWKGSYHPDDMLLAEERMENIEEIFHDRYHYNARHFLKRLKEMRG